MLPLQFIMLPLQFIMSPEQFIKLPLQFHVKDANVNKFSGTNYLSLYMRFWYLWHHMGRLTRTLAACIHKD